MFRSMLVAAAMPQRLCRVFAAAVLGGAFLVGCATRSAPVPLNVTRVWVIPVAPIPHMYTENKGVPLGVIWQSIADTIKSNDFTQRLDQTRQSSASRMTDALVNALNAQGFDARVLQGVQRLPKDPNYIDPKKLPTTDPVLHVYFNEVGMYSSRFSMDYVPRMNVYAELIDSGNNDIRLLRLRVLRRGCPGRSALEHSGRPRVQMGQLQCDGRAAPERDRRLQRGGRRHCHAARSQSERRSQSSIARRTAAFSRADRRSISTAVTDAAGWHTACIASCTQDRMLDDGA